MIWEKSSILFVNVFTSQILFSRPSPFCIKIEQFSKKWAIHSPFFIYIRRFNTISMQLIFTKICQRLDSNSRSLVSEETPLPMSHNHCPEKVAHHLHASKVSCYVKDEDDGENKISKLFAIKSNLANSNVYFFFYIALAQIIKEIFWPQFTWTQCDQKNRQLSIKAAQK